MVVERRAAAGDLLSQALTRAQRRPRWRATKVDDMTWGRPAEPLGRPTRRACPGLELGPSDALVRTWHLLRRTHG
jgi:hypothetical protein